MTAPLHDGVTTLARGTRADTRAHVAIRRRSDVDPPPVQEVQVVGGWPDRHEPVRIVLPPLLRPKGRP